MSFNDQKHCGLLVLTGETYGHINDLEHLLLSTAVTTPPAQVNDMWHTYWDDQLILKGHFNDRAYQWLGMIGYSQNTLSERWYAFWTDACDGDIDPGLPEFDLIFPLGWTLEGLVDGVESYANFTRPAGVATVEDFEGFVQTCKDGEARFWRARRVENIYIGDSDLMDVLTFPVEIGKNYQISMAFDEIISTIIISGQGFSSSLISTGVAGERAGMVTGSMVATGTGDVDIVVVAGNPYNVIVEETPEEASMWFSEYVNNSTDYGANAIGVQYFPTDRDGGNLAGMRGCLVEEGDPAYDPATGIQGTTQSETLNVSRPVVLNQPSVNDILIGLRTHTVRDDANAADNTVSLFIDGIDGDNNFRIQNNSTTYTSRKRIAAVNYEAVVADDFLSKSRDHVAVLNSVDGMEYRINGVEGLNPNADNLVGLDGGDGLIHLGTNNAGAGYMNAGISLVVVVN